MGSAINTIENNDDLVKIHKWEQISKNDIIDLVKNQKWEEASKFCDQVCYNAVKNDQDLFGIRLYVMKSIM